MSETPASPAPSAQPSTRLYCIDFLRGSASLAVVLYHCALYFRSDQSWYPAFFTVLQEGRLGVPLFFVISGFCIHLRWARQSAAGENATINFRDFWKRRFLRLYPAYLVMLCITMALIVAAVYYPQMSAFVHREEKNAALTGWWMVADFVSHLFMLHGLHPAFDLGGGNEVYWTLAREEYLYLLYLPLLMWRRTWGLARAIGLVIFISLSVPMAGYITSKVLRLDQDWFYPISMSNSAIALWPQWALGMVAVEAYFGEIKLPRWCSYWWMAVVWIVLSWVNTEYGIWQLSAIFRGLSFFTLINYCVSREKAGQWLSNAIAGQLTNIGIFSYSLYLVHYPLIRAMVGVEELLRAKWGITSVGPLYYLIVYSVMVIVSCLAGKLLFILVEQRCLPSAGRLPLAGGHYGPAETVPQATAAKT